MGRGCKDGGKGVLGRWEGVGGVDGAKPVQAYIP